jgi:hypothetical protein
MVCRFCCSCSFEFSSIFDPVAQIFAPAIRACLAGDDNQVNDFAHLSERALCAAVDASVDSLKQQLLCAHCKVKKCVLAKIQLQEALDKDPGKFFISKMATGSIDDFHKGLQDRIGKFDLFCFTL